MAYSAAAHRSSSETEHSGYIIQIRTGRPGQPWGSARRPNYQQSADCPPDRDLHGSAPPVGAGFMTPRPRFFCLSRCSAGPLDHLGNAAPGSARVALRAMRGAG